MFYVSFVVPIGTEILGSARSQGFITQQVTNWLNVVCGCAIGMMLIETIRGRIASVNRRRWTELVTLILIGCFLLAMIWLHQIMDRMINVTDESITDANRFYGLHRIYLWLSTFQWIAAWVWLIFCVARWQDESEQIRPIP